MEELLKQILEENKKLVSTVSTLVSTVSTLSSTVSRIEKTQTSMAKDLKAVKEYQHKGLDVDVEKLQNRVRKIEDVLKIS